MMVDTQETQTPFTVYFTGENGAILASQMQLAIETSGFVCKIQRDESGSSKYPVKVVNPYSKFRPIIWNLEELTEALELIKKRKAEQAYAEEEKKRIELQRKEEQLAKQRL